VKQETLQAGMHSSGIGLAKNRQEVLKKKKKKKKK
jgi:hypothetical protein